jgi:hypothetical protein
MGGNLEGGVRPITESEVGEVFELVERRWRRVVALRGFDLADAREEQPEPVERPGPRARLYVWPQGAAGVRLWVAAWDTDRARLERCGEGLAGLFADGPLVWDGVPLRGGAWSITIADPHAGEWVDEDEWSPASVREAGGGAAVRGGWEPVACEACGAVVRIRVGDAGPVICRDCHALDEARAAEADDGPPPERFPPHPMVHLLGAESRWWAPGEGRGRGGGEGT